VLVDAGVLQGFLHNSLLRAPGGHASPPARRCGATARTPAVGARALAIAPGTLSQDELLAEVGDGLLVQGVHGLHSGVNPVSGDFSVGATGVMFRDGTLAEPVREITIASTLQRMLLDIAAVGHGRGSCDVALSGS
jgi:PmbA protein